MRKLAVLAVALVFGGAFLVAQTKPAAPKPAAAASNVVDVGWKCTPPNPMNAIPVSDTPGHAYGIQQVTCTATKGEIAGVKNKSGVGVEFFEAKGDASTGHGIFIETLANGDKINYSYTFKGTGKDNKLVSGTNTWQATGGTGKFKGITAKGSCTAKGTPDGGAQLDCKGAYEIK